MALCFEVRINDDEPLIAGLDDISVLTAVVSFVSSRNDLQCRVDGLVSRGQHDKEHLEWLERELRVGDRVSIRVIVSERVSPPLRRERQDPELVEEEERKYYELLKARYESK